eukprot:scaffold1842_cov414-Pavlova_lutheri.AAC.2
MDNSAVSGMACSRARRVVPIPAQRSSTVIVLSGLAESSTGWREKAEFHVEWGIICQFFDPARVAGRQLLYALCRKRQRRSSGELGHQQIKSM